MHGHGTRYYQDGTKYIGEFRQGGNGMAMERYISQTKGFYMKVNSIMIYLMAKERSAAKMEVSI